MLFCRKPLKNGLNAEKPHFSVRLFTFLRNGRVLNAFINHLITNLIRIKKSNTTRMTKYFLSCCFCFQKVLPINLLNISFKKIAILYELKVRKLYQTNNFKITFLILLIGTHL